MIKKSETSDWREARRCSAREDILEAAWTLTGEEGLAGLSLRELARRAGITPPTVYAYFDSKNAIYDAMFGQAATQFAEEMAQPFDSDDPHEILVASVHRFFDFCTSDPVRYQLLFQRTLPEFEPSPESYAPAQRALVSARGWLVLNGIVDTRYLDMWTALLTGLVDQQISNDPGEIAGPASSRIRWPCSSRIDSRPMVLASRRLAHVEPSTRLESKEPDDHQDHNRWGISHFVNPRRGHALAGPRT